MNDSTKSENYYALITQKEVAIIDSPDEFARAISTCTSPILEVSSVDDLDVLWHYIIQKYPISFYQHDTSRVGAPLGLPALPQTFAYQQQEVTITGDLYIDHFKNQLQNQINFGFWAISALNGYVVTSGFNNMISVLCHPLTSADGLSVKLVRPRAIWTADKSAAMKLAHNDYIRRFYGYFDARENRIALPNCLVNIWIDLEFSNRKPGGKELQLFTSW